MTALLAGLLAVPVKTTLTVPLDENMGPRGKLSTSGRFVGEHCRRFLAE
jgi:hypothetical protein